MLDSLFSANICQCPTLDTLAGTSPNPTLGIGISFLSICGVICLIDPKMKLATWNSPFGLIKGPNVISKGLPGKVYHESRVEKGVEGRGG